MLFFSCTSQKSPYSFVLPGKGRVRLYQKRMAAAAGANPLSKVHNASTPWYVLAKAVDIGEQGKAFFIEYKRTDFAIQLLLSDARGRTVAKIPLPSAAVGKSGVVEFLYPLGPGDILGGFQLQASQDIPADILLSAGIKQEFDGVRFSKDETVIGYGMNCLEQGVFEFSHLVSDLIPGQEQIQIELEYQDDGLVSHGNIKRIICTQGRQEAVLRLVLKPGRHRVYLYSSSLGFVPDRLDLDLSDQQTVVRSLVVRKLPGFDHDTNKELEPLPADLRTIADYNREFWRGEDFELFSWNLYPRVLILDFADFEIQARFLKRLAFFVEKKGYAGRILSNQELEGVHGWNAHDYNPEDLARFFNQARQQGYSLNPEEDFLRDILLARGLLVLKDNQLLPGPGALVAISRQSSGTLRSKLLLHESLHAIFFTSRRFREACISVWESQTLTFQRFFREFLDLHTYNTNDYYLLVNEFMAYCLQQPPPAAEDYFRNNWAFKRVMSSSPGNNEFALFFKANPSPFYDAATLLESALKEEIAAGTDQLECLIPEK